MLVHGPRSEIWSQLGSEGHMMLALRPEVWFWLSVEGVVLVTASVSRMSSRS